MEKVKTKITNLPKAVKNRASNLKSKAAEYRAKRPHRSFRKTVRARQKLGGAPVPSVAFLLADCWNFLRRQKWPLIRLTLLYSVITYLVVGGVSQLDFIALREATMDVFGGETAAAGTMMGLFGNILGGAAFKAPSEIQQVLGTLISFIFWLAIVWFARMRLANKPVNVRDALYNCCAPLIPSLILMIIIILQLLPVVLALIILTILQASGIAQSGVEAMLAFSAVSLILLMTIYWLGGSLLALIIVTLPQTYPWKALRAGSELVIGQRWRLALHIVLLVVLVIVSWSIIIGLALLLDSWLRVDWLPIVPVLVQLLSGFTLVFTAIYIYKLYRSLL